MKEFFDQQVLLLITNKPLLAIFCFVLGVFFGALATRISIKKYGN